VTTTGWSGAPPLGKAVARGARSNKALNRTHPLDRTAAEGESVGGPRGYEQTNEPGGVLCGHLHRGRGRVDADATPVPR
jgi:hypothetical protein